MVDTLILCPLPYFFLSPSPSPLLSNAPSIPHGSEAGNSIRSITEPLEISAFSACIGAKDSETDTCTYSICTHTHKAHTHSGYLRSEIINANKAAAADREGGGGQSQGQVILKQAKPRKKTR